MESLQVDTNAKPGSVSPLTKSRTAQVITRERNILNSLSDNIQHIQRKRSSEERVGQSIATR